MDRIKVAYDESHELLETIECLIDIVDMVYTRKVPMTMTFFGFILIAVLVSMLSGVNDWICARGNSQEGCYISTNHHTFSKTYLTELHELSQY